MRIYTKRVVDGVVVDIPDGVEYVEEEVRQLARSIAAEIRENGHMQLSRPQLCLPGQVCIITSTTWRENSEAWPARFTLARLLTGRDIEATADIQPVWEWNDSTATADVLARLDAIADGWAAQ